MFLSQLSHKLLSLVFPFCRAGRERSTTKETTTLFFTQIYFHLWHLAEPKPEAASLCQVSPVHQPFPSPWPQHSRGEGGTEVLQAESKHLFWLLPIVDSCRETPAWPCAKNLHGTARKGCMMLMALCPAVSIQVAGKDEGSAITGGLQPMVTSTGF